LKVQVKFKIGFPLDFDYRFAVGANG